MIKLKIEMVCDYCGGGGETLEPHRKQIDGSGIPKYQSATKNCPRCNGTGRVFKTIAVYSYQEIMEKETGEEW